MSLQGTIIKLDDGRLAFEHISANYSTPETIRHLWAIEFYSFKGMGAATEEDAIGKPASIMHGQISCYLGNGRYMAGHLKDGGSTPAISVEVKPAPRPRVRKGTELRWQAGHWEKHTKSHGWVAA